MRKPGDFSRRHFLFQSMTGVSAAWLAAQWPEILAARDHAMQAVASATPPRLEFFSPQQAADVEAICSTIIPTTDTPGAREAGVIYFIDRSLMTFAQDQREPFLRSLAAVTEITRYLFPAAAGFAALSPDQQVAALKAVEATKPDDKRESNLAAGAKPSSIDGQQVIGTFRFATILGFLANPEYGGNRNHVGWDVVNFKPSMAHFPPFGFYDKEYREQHGAAPGAKKP
jgi:gluconate 2-dehydrogenase gamma chain